jgi:hypothetical protein
MWTTIALQLLYICITGSLSWYFTKQNKLAKEVIACPLVHLSAADSLQGKRPALEQIEGFRYAP